MKLRTFVCCIALFSAIPAAVHAESARFGVFRTISAKAAKGIGVEPPQVVLAKGPYGGDLNVAFPFKYPTSVAEPFSWGITVGEIFVNRLSDELLFFTALSLACAKKEGHYEDGFTVSAKDAIRVDACVWEAIGEDLYVDYLRQTWAVAGRSNLQQQSDDDLKSYLRKLFGK